MRDLIATALTRDVALMPTSAAAWADRCVASLPADPRIAAGAVAEFEPLADASMAGYGEDNYWPAADSWMAYFRPYVVKNGLLQIPVKGVLVNGMSYAIGDYATGYPYIARALQRGLADGNVRGIVFVCNSPGGEVSGNFDLVDEIFAARGQKPIQAVVADYAYSACYSIASATSKITIARTGGAGSIGVVMWHVECSEYMLKLGYKFTPIFAGSHKVDGNPYEALSPEVKAAFQTRIDSLYTIFTQTVARNLGIDEQIVRDTEAACYGAQEALDIGLVHAVGTFDEALSAFSDSLDSHEDTFMSTASAPEAQTVPLATHESAVATARADGVVAGSSAERTRIQAIIGSDEAKGRTALANMLAFETDNTPEAAVKLLGVSAKEPEPGNTQANSFTNAMNNGNEQPIVQGEGNDEPDAAATILADQAKAAGRKTKK